MISAIKMIFREWRIILISIITLYFMLMLGEMVDIYLNHWLDDLSSYTELPWSAEIVLEYLAGYRVISIFMAILWMVIPIRFLINIGNSKDINSFKIKMYITILCVVIIGATSASLAILPILRCTVDYQSTRSGENIVTIAINCLFYAGLVILLILVAIKYYYGRGQIET